MDFESVRDMIEPGSFGLYKVTTDCSEREIWEAAQVLGPSIKIPNATVTVQLLDGAHGTNVLYLVIVRRPVHTRR